METTIFLTGFMGVGKSTLGKRIASKLGFQFIDLDSFIEMKHKASIPVIIDTFGIEKFRVWESEALKEIPLSGVVCSTGGGTPCYFDNMDWMNKYGTTVWIYLSEGAIFSRLAQGEREKRPLLRGKNDEQLKKFITESLVVRNPFYEQAKIKYDAIKMPMKELLSLFGRA